MSVKNLTVFNVYPAKRFNIQLKYPPQYITFELHGASLAIANAIRRVCESEIPTKRLTIRLSEDIKTNDVFFIPEFFDILLRTMPISQDIPLDKTFRLYKRINDADDVDITTDDIGGIEKYAIKSFPIATLCGTIKNAPILTKSNDFIELSLNIHVIEARGYEDGRHNQCEAGSAVLQPMSPPKSYGGQSALIEAPESFYIKMISRNGMSPEQLFRNMFSVLIARLRNIEEVAKNFEQDNTDNEIYKVFVENENTSTAELILYEVFELDPDIELFTYDHRISPGNIVFRGRSSDIDIVMKNAINSIIKKLDKLSGQFKGIAEVDCFGTKELQANLLKTFGHLPLLNDDAEIARTKTGNMNVSGGWIHL